MHGNKPLKIGLLKHLMKLADLSEAADVGRRSHAAAYPAMQGGIPMPPSNTM